MKAPRPPLLLAVALTAALAGCGEEFPPFNRLSTTDLRLLAVRTTPVAPAFGETTTMDLLVWNPDPATPNVTYQWRWCPFTGPSNQGHQCPPQEAFAFVPNLPAFDLGTGPTATFTNTVDPALFTCVCATLEQRATACPPGVADQLPPAIDCSLGFPAKIRVTVSNGVQTVDAVRTLRLRFSDAHPPNENPTLGGLAAVVGGVEVPLDGGMVVLPRKRDSLLRITMPAVAEVYRPAGAAADEQESLFLTWYVQSGDTRILRTSFIPTITSPQKPFENEWTPAGITDFAGPQARVIVVAGDNRNGFGWTEGVVTLGDEP